MVCLYIEREWEREKFVFNIKLQFLLLYLLILRFISFGKCIWWLQTNYIKFFLSALTNWTFISWAIGDLLIALVIAD